MKRTKYLLPLLVLMVTSCGSSIINEPVELKEPTSLKNIIFNLGATNNFMIEKHNTKGQMISKYEYHPQYVYERFTTKGYLTKDSKVYPFVIEKEEVHNKEEIVDGSLYNKNHVKTSFKAINLDSISDDVLTFTTLKSSIVLPLLDICGYYEEDYTRLKDVTLEATSGDMNSLKISFNFNNRDLTNGGFIVETETSNIVKFNEGNNETILDFIKNGTIVPVSNALTKVRDLFNNDNYTQLQYDASGEYSQVDLFNPNYFVTCFTEDALKREPMLRLSQKGYLEIIEPDKELNLVIDSKGNPVPLIYDDIYLYQFTGSYEDQDIEKTQLFTRNNPNRIGYAQGAFQDVFRDVTLAFHYPKDLTIFKNLDQFDELLKEENHGLYETTNERLVDNFLEDYALTGGFDSFGGVTSIQIEYTFDKENESNSVVLFKIMTPSGSYDITYTKFNDTTFLPFEKVLEDIKNTK